MKASVGSSHVVTNIPKRGIHIRRPPAVPALRVSGRVQSDTGHQCIVPAMLRIDFGDGECVKVTLKHQPDFSHMLHTVGAAGLRRKAANGFPTHDAPLVRRLEDIDITKDYMVWPKPDKEDRRAP